MKKLSIVAVALVALAGIAYASSLGVPWFVDNAPAGSGYPPSSGTLGLVYLKNNTDADLTCTILYVNSTGDILGPFSPDNEFLVPKYATVGFRPVLNDLGGQESATAAAVPDRPRSSDFGGGPIPGSIAADGSGEVIDDKKNGSIVISWTGGPADVQGMNLTVGGTNGGLSYAHLLPPGS
jgi:hypothetical protein